MKQPQLLCLVFPLTSVIVGGAACGDDLSIPPPPRPERLPVLGQKYIVDSIDVPESSGDAPGLGFDLDDDGEVDNALGGTIGLVNSALGESSQVDVDRAVVSGEIMHLLMLSTTVAAELDVARLYLGQDADDDPNNNFDGDAELVVRDSSPVDRAFFGLIGEEESNFDEGEVVVENTLFAVVTLPLVRAHLTVRELDDGSLIGKFGGAILLADVDADLKPAVRTKIIADVARDCLGTTFPTCCEADSRGAAMWSFFDRNEDCSVDLDELDDGSLLEIFFVPDIDTDDDDVDDALSVGFGFTAVPARFDIPR